jgi:MYXO-CTERM domain-containing protein
MRQRTYAPVLQLALLALALWPTWWWLGRRMLDGSDDPLGILALGALAALLWRQRRHVHTSPRLGLQAAALLGAVLTTAGQSQLPDLLTALMGLLSFAAAILAFLPSCVARAPVWGLSVLSLPLLASLQFYAGFPLRVITAQASLWLLRTAHTVERTGSSLLVDGQLIIVDAPCSGVQMVWLGYFTACVVALLTQRSQRSFLWRLPVVSVFVLLGNVLRNTVLVSAQASSWHLPAWGHDTVGLLVLGLVCCAIAWVISRPENRQTSQPEPLQAPPPPANRQALWNTLLMGCALFNGLCIYAGSQHPISTALQSAIEPPTHWNGTLLRPLALSDVEQRFAKHFPGSLMRMTNGQQALTLRTVRRPTRMLHPANDCYKALGYRLHSEQLEIQNKQRWRCFVAQHSNGKKWRVCERIEDAQGQEYTDTSAWYWAAVMGQSQGPWQAVTVATVLHR